MHSNNELEVVSLNSANSSTALYVTENGIERMFTDLRDYIYPVYVKCQPLMYALTKIAFILIPLIAIGLIAFLHIQKKHRFGRKLLKKKNYIILGSALAAYVLLSFIEVKLFFGFTLGPSSFVLPLIAKFFGSYVSALFAIAQYFIASIIALFTNSGSFNFYLMLIAAISGMLYGIFYYKKRTKYSRCLGGKLVVNIVCNIILTVLVVFSQSSEDIATLMTYATIESLLIAPIQALVLYGLFRLARIIKNKIKRG